MFLRRHADWLKVGQLEEELNISLSEQVVAARAAARPAPMRPAKAGTGSGYILLGHLAGLTGMMGFVLVILTIIVHVVVHTQTSGMGYLVGAIGCFVFAAIGSSVVKEVRQNPVGPLAKQQSASPAASDRGDEAAETRWRGAECQANLLPSHPWYDRREHEREEPAADWLAGIGGGARRLSETPGQQCRCTRCYRHW